MTEEELVDPVINRISTGTPTSYGDATTTIVGWALVYLFPGKPSEMSGTHLKIFVAIFPDLSHSAKLYIVEVFARELKYAKSSDLLTTV